MKTTLLSVSCLLALAASVRADDWPQWQGPLRNNISRETGLLRSWPQGGPRLLWTSETIGMGYSSPAVVGNRLYIQGARDGRDLLLAIDVEKGKELWSAEISPEFHQDRGDGPRSTPTVDKNQVFALGAQGNLICVDADTGERLWLKRLKEELHGQMMSGWGYSESPLVDGNQVICTPGGNQGTLAALDRKTGNVLWRSEDYHDKAGYSSVVISEAAGVKQYVQMTGQSVAGIRPRDGKLLWRFPRESRVAAIPTPVCFDNYVYVTSGYGAGCALLKITGSEENLKATQVYANKNMVNHHGGVLLLGGYVYGYSDGKGWICQDVETGKIKWQERTRLPKGSITCADGMLYCYSENDGTIMLVEASPEHSFQSHGRFRIPESSKLPRPSKQPDRNVWTHPVVANGRLYLRDQDLLFCFDIRDSK